MTETTSTQTVPAATHNIPLHDFLAHDSIAIVGASADPTKRGYKAMVGLIKGNYRGRIYPLNPKVPEILGVPTYASLDDIPGPVDLALICTPAATLPGLMAECGRKGVKGAVILASGFRETGPEGAKLEQQVLDAAREPAERAYQRGGATAPLLGVPFSVKEQIPVAERLELPGPDADDALLRSVSAFETYRHVYRDVITPYKVAELLILNHAMPRSLHACLDEINDILGDIANLHSAEATRQAGELHATLHYGRMDDIFEAGLHPWLERFLARINRLGDSIGQNFLVPVAA